MSLAWTGPSMRAALEESKPGCCVFCDAPVRRRNARGKRKRDYPLMCGRRECLRGYWNAYHRDVWAAQRAGFMMADKSVADG